MRNKNAIININMKLNIANPNSNTALIIIAMLRA